MAEDMALALLKARGYNVENIVTERRGRAFVAIIRREGSSERPSEALGSNPFDAEDKLVRMLLRP